MSGPEHTNRPVTLITISDDRLAAHLHLCDSNADEIPSTRAEVDDALESAGVVCGILVKRLDAAWQRYRDRGPADQPVCVAMGRSPVSGRDAQIEYQIEPPSDSWSALEDDSAIDFRELGRVVNVLEGETIATWTPPTSGQPGMGVDGAELPATPGSNRPYRTGPGVKIFELASGQIELRAAADGTLQVGPEEAIAVVELYEVPGDVDLSTGNIDATGSVLVRGSVKSSFHVTASHDITIGGSVEGAVICSGGELLVGGSILGGPGAHVSANTRVSAKFVRNASITCEGGMEVRDSETGSDITCRGRFVATEGRGLVRGGSYIAMAGFVVRDLGSVAGAPTKVWVGSDPVLVADLESVLSRLRDVQGKARKLKRQFSRGTSKRLGATMTPQQGLAVRREMKSQRELFKSSSSLEARRARLEAELCDGDPPVIEVQGTVYPGVVLQIRNVTINIESRAAGVCYSIDAQDGTIESTPLLPK